MKYEIPYFCISHIGRCRQMNQDNFVCDESYGELGGEGTYAPSRNAARASAPDTAVLTEPRVLSGSLCSECPALLGIFDGLGGEECGEVASFMAAKEASSFPLNGDPEQMLLTLCQRTNARICWFAERNGLQTTGTTAAMLSFGPKEMALCNIGDSKLFCYSNRGLEQLSVDHLCAVPYGRKAPLSQYLGIPPAEMLIEPYTARLSYRIGDRYLICSDGLTDMVPREEIAGILEETGSVTPCGDAASALEAASRKLLERALAHGGKDNITIILCRIMPEQDRKMS